jgi:hypothetical protein
MYLNPKEITKIPSLLLNLHLLIVKIYSLDLVGKVRRHPSIRKFNRTSGSDAPYRLASRDTSLRETTAIATAQMVRTFLIVETIAIIDFFLIPSSFSYK